MALKDQATAHGIKIGYGAANDPVPARDGGYAKTGMHNIKNLGPCDVAIMTLDATDNVIDSEVILVGKEMASYSMPAGGDAIAFALIETDCEGATIKFDPPNIA